MTSLRKRAIAGAIVWACAVTVAGTLLLGRYLEQQSAARLNEMIAARHDRTVVALANSSGDPAALAGQLTDPTYQRPFSGEYWQIESLDTGQVITSRSLADVLMEPAQKATAKLTFDTQRGPAGQALITSQQKITLSDGTRWTVQVASSTDNLQRGTAELLDRIYTVFGLSGAFAGVGALLLVLLTLRPIEKLRRDVADRWNSEGLLPVESYPVEVVPLVDDINTLMTSNRDILSRSRRQAADLAHALKTPSAILRNELQALESDGVAVTGSLDALNRLDAQLKRTLARMRAVQTAENAKTNLDVTQALERMARAFTSLARNAHRQLNTDIAHDLHLKVDRNDLDEVCGNLLDNAVKWSRAEISFAATLLPKGVRITVEDDGPGVPEAERTSVLKGGLRLDEATPGTGLGLSIAADLVGAYGGTLNIATSDQLGGAKMEVFFPFDAYAGQAI